MWRQGLVAPQQVGSSQIRDQLHVPCVGLWILNHWTTREAPISLTLGVVCQKQHFLELLPSPSLLLNHASAGVSPPWGGKPQTSH